jgi:TM2 domain-containing membrane protein YozV
MATEALKCKGCGAPIAFEHGRCPYCGAYLIPKKEARTSSRETGRVSFAPPPPKIPPSPAAPPAPPRVGTGGKNKIVAGILALFLGGIGVHKAYLGKIGAFVLCVLFCWTGIPAIVAFIEAIILFCMSDEAFDAKYNRHR